MKLFDSEWKVMEVLWQDGDTTAKELSLRLADSAGWNKNTTYTVIKKCVEKGAIERREPNFLCHACITKEAAQQEEADTLLDQGLRRLGRAAVCVGPEPGESSRKRSWNACVRWWRRRRDERVPSCGGEWQCDDPRDRAAAVDRRKTAAAGAVSGAVVRGGVSAAAAGAAARPR